MFIVTHRKIFFTLSALLIVGSIIAMFAYGLNFGIDFTGGSVMEVSYANARPTAGGKCILTPEELATLYHFPIQNVGTTELRKVESRKGGPPASLPMVE